MKIAFFTDSYIPQKNGVTTAVENLKKSLEKKGHTVYIIAPKFPKYATTKTVIRIPSFQVEKSSNSRFAFYFPAKSLRVALKIKYDIIHGHSGGPISLLGWEVARRQNIPYIFTYHTLWNQYAHYFLHGKVITPKLIERATRIFSNMSSAVIAPSKRVEEELLSYGVTKPISVIPSGIDTAAFRGKPNKYLHSLLSIPTSHSILLFVGRLGKEKTIDFLIKSLVKVQEELPATDLVIIGEGSEHTSLRKLAEKLGVASSVHLTGSMEYDELLKAYKSADAFVFSSKTETQGMVILEALASRLPVVTLNRAPLNEVITHRQNGILTDFTPTSFAQGVVEVLTNPKLKNTLIRNAEKTAKEYSIYNLTGTYLNIYRELVSHPDTSKVEIKKKFFSFFKRQFSSL